MENVNESEEIKLTDWTKEEKVSLFYAIKAHGSKDIQKIQEDIATKTYEQVRTALEHYTRKAGNTLAKNKKKKEKCKVACNPRIPLASWAKFLTDSLTYKELQTETVNAMHLLADLEDIPSEACTENVNFRKIYNQIASAMEGKPLPDDKLTNSVLRLCMVETALVSKAFIRNSAFKAVVDNVNISQGNINGFPRPTSNNELATIRHLSAQRNYNPLNVPEEYLKPSFTNKNIFNE